MLGGPGQGGRPMNNPPPPPPEPAPLGPGMSKDPEIFANRISGDLQNGNPKPPNAQVCFGGKNIIPYILNIG